MKSKIKLSIVIALAPWRSAEILQYLKKQTYKKKLFEIIIEKGLNVPDNRNNGVKRAKGELIVFLDDDAIITQDFLQKVEDFFTKYKEIDILGGPQLTPESDKTFARVSGYALTDPFGSPVNKRYRKAPLTLNADNTYITGANFVCKKKVFNKLNFNRNVYPADEGNFLIKAKKEGFKIAYSPEIFVFHRRRPDFSSLAKQIFDYGKSKPKQNILSELLKKPFHIIPSIFLLYLFTLPLLLIFSNIAILPLLVYLLLSLTFTLYHSIRNVSLATLFLLPFIYLTIHISYGLGFIIGILLKIFEQNEKY